MDPSLFDTLTRTFRAAPSRRAALAALAGMLMPSLLLAPDAEGKKKKKKKKKCKVNCRGRVCGPSNCKGKSCGSCPRGERCTGDGECICDRSCQGKDCGPDGCGGSCGQCNGASKCNTRGQCVDCLGEDDCANGQVCTSQQSCCTPSCDGRHCASDGCGGACPCPNGTTCDGATCVCPQAGQVLCDGTCVTAECCSPDNRPGILCGQVCLDQVACCPNGQDCDRTEQCCGFDRANPADRAICQEDRCCQQLGGACGGQAITCCQGSCKLGVCDDCEPETCCTNHAPGCPGGQKCCGTTCIAENACCTRDTPGCGQFQKCCGGACIPEEECCTNGQANVCPDNAPVCLDGQCFQCGSPVDCEFRPCRQTMCNGGQCEYPAGHEGDQCLIESSEDNGVCCGGECSQCCGGDATTCPAPPVACLVKSCDEGRCVPVPVSVSGPYGDCNLCCTNGDCCDDTPGSICGDNGRCCFAAGVVTADPAHCCSGERDILSKCT